MLSSNRSIRLVGVTAVALVLVGVGCGGTPRKGGRQPYKYTVGAGDVLAISVWKETELTQRPVTVAPDGTLNVPLAGPIQVQDKGLAEIADTIRGKLAHHITSPIVSVSLVESRSTQIMVIGEVRNQSPVAYRDRMGVVEAISRAGGPLWAYAKVEDVRVIRGGLNRPEMIEIDLEDVFDGDEPDVFLEPGDIVVVPSKKVTQFDRWVTQALAPFRLGATTGSSAASTATTIGTAVVIP